MDFNSEEANSKQRAFLERIERISNSVRTDILDYYFERVPDTEGEAREYLEGIQRYLKSAHDDINNVLDDIHRELE